MTLKITQNGMTELLASGVTTYTRTQATQAFRLLDEIRQRGHSDPGFVLRYVHTRAPQLKPLLASALSERGYDVHCRLCARGVDGRKYSKHTIQHQFGMLVRRGEMAQHRRHAAARRRSSWHGTDLGRPESSREAWEPPPPSQNEQGRNLLQGKDAVPPLDDSLSASVLLGEVPATWNGFSALKKPPSKETT
jgi:hypothetical protein